MTNLGKSPPPRETETSDSAPGPSAQTLGEPSSSRRRRLETLPTVGVGGAGPPQTLAGAHMGWTAITAQVRSERPVQGPEHLSRGPSQEACGEPDFQPGGWQARGGTSVALGLSVTSALNRTHGLRGRAEGRGPGGQVWIELPRTQLPASPGPSWGHSPSWRRPGTLLGTLGPGSAAHPARRPSRPPAASAPALPFPGAAPAPSIRP